MREPRIDIDGPGEATRLVVTYTDGTNHKFTSPMVLAGRITAEQAAMLVGKLASGGEFVPRDVGMPMLQTVSNGFWHSSDHAWHTLDEIATTTDAPTADVDLASMLLRWSAVDEWDPDTAEAELADELGPAPDGDEDDDEGEEPARPAP
ncbi:hypothetical protein [Methylobacterium radiotolerans]|uniref:hypothetical protein n=1 Tax=Methylobacterium radiotolerans TaxID=31998 RepID=UPI0038D0CABF